MTPDRALYRLSAVFFAVFSLAVLVAFWPSYFSRLASQPDIRFHLHGAALTAWCVLLVTQGLLVRVGQRSLHRAIGKVSFVLVPIVVVTTVHLIHYRLQGVVGAPPDSVLYFLALILNALVAFLALYGLAMSYRRVPAIHARYMVATVFPLFTPVTDRLIGQYWPSLVPAMPRIGNAVVLPVAGFVLADLLLLGLALWDWRSRRRLGPFAIALGVVAAYHVSVLTLHRTAAWRELCQWFLSLPLS
jgi:hypothetical protein